MLKLLSYKVNHYEKNMNSKRQCNFELLRIVCILMVISLHFLSHGKVLEGVQYGSANYYIAWGVYTFSYCAVNCFVLISGYFGVTSQFKVRKLLLLWLTVLFYSVFSYALCCIAGVERFSLIKLFRTFIPVVSNEYWFFTCYIVLYITSFSLNDFAKRTSKRMLQKTIVCGLVLFSFIPTIAGDYLYLKSGYGIVWFVFLYMVGAYIKLYGVRSIGYPGKMYFILLLLLWASKVGIESVSRKLFGMEQFSGVFFQYNSIIAFLASVSLFLWFKNMKEIKSEKISKTIRYIATLTFGVYLFHDNLYIRNLLWSRVLPVKLVDSLQVWPYEIIVSIGILCVGGIIDRIRMFLFEFLKIEGRAEKIENISKNIIFNVVKKGETLWPPLQ